MVAPDFNSATIYEYNAEGQRTLKVVGSAETDYFYNGSQLFASGERVYNQSGAVTGYRNMLEFFYDEDGRPMAFCYDRTDYYTYLLNLQGDVVAILDDDFNVVVEYTYSAYGEILSITGSLASTIGQINPLRYRGYYYDVETGFYYLNSRYYDPVVGRFLSPDSIVASTGDGVNGLNMYAYCFNNPVNLSDSSGNWPMSIQKIVTTVVTVAKVLYACVSISNSTHNSEVDSDPSTTTENKIINDQNGATGANFKYGLYSASWNACEAIAVHNAKVINGMDSSLSSTIKDFQLTGAMIGYGFFGSNPYAIGGVLDKEGIAYSRVGMDNMAKSGTYIISFWNNNAPWNGLHTVAISYDGSAYTAYNLYGDGSVYTIALSDYSNRFICAYYLG